MNILSLYGVNKSFINSGQHYTVLHHISLDVQHNEIISIVGVSGSGKTTLLNIIADLEKIDSGTIQKKTDLRINYVTQYAHFIEELTIHENLVFASLKDKDSDKKIELYTQKFQCTYLLSKKPSALSGGEKQRINMIRALLNNPQLIILDEPTASLDHDNKFKVIDTLLELQKEKNIAIIIVSHDQEIIHYLPEHTSYELYKKQLVQK